jgi:hypothetical protein
MKFYVISREYISQLINQFPVKIVLFVKVINIVFMKMCKTVFTCGEEIHLHHSSPIENNFVEINNHSYSYAVVKIK